MLLLTSEGRIPAFGSGGFDGQQPFTILLFFDTGDTLYLAERAFTYTPENPDVDDDVKCTTIRVTEKNDQKHEASVQVSYFNSSASKRDTLTDTYVFSTVGGGNMYNKLRATTEDDEIGGAFRVMVAKEGCAVLKIDVDALPKRETNAQPLSRSVQEEPETVTQERSACFILIKRGVSKDLLTCCDGALATECNYQKQARHDYQDTCPADENTSPSAGSNLEESEAQS